MSATNPLLKVMIKNLPSEIVTRFAPSPTGALHLGHVYSALFARHWADRHDGEMRLRIDDIDFTRSQDQFKDLIFEDLAFLGIPFDGEVMVQSKRQDRYQSALKYLEDQEFIYPCTLTRRELNELLSAPHGGNMIIRNTDQFKRSAEDIGRNNTAWRLRMDNIVKTIPALSYTEWRDGSSCEEISIDLDRLDDVVVARKDIGTSYHLSVVLDDADSNVSVVTRGNDLEESTPIHRLLQVLLGLEETVWAHHELITDDEGKRLAKRDSAQSIQFYRQNGLTAEEILRKIS